MPKIRFINNGGGGFAGEMDVPPDFTLGQLFVQEIGESVRPENYLIRHNGVTESIRSTILREGDRVSIVPRKLEGA